MSDEGGERDGATREGSDVLFVHSPNERGDGLRVIRKRETASATDEGGPTSVIELGELREIHEGKPIHGDVVRLKPRTEHDRLFDVETVLKRPATKELLAGHGPAQVATRTYRANYDAIFGARDEKPN